MKARILFFLEVLIFSISLVSCVGITSTREVHLVDSLNTRAYQLRYVNIKASEQAALKAYRSCQFYDRGKAEACNNLAFCFFIRMDFEEAEQLYKKVATLTKNETELLIADIELMKIYQRTSMNESFYDRRNDAKRRMRRIDQDMSRIVSPHDIRRVNYAYTEFCIASTIYYYYLRQHNEALAAINSVDPNRMSGDSCQWMYYHYVKSSSDLYSGVSQEEDLLNCFDELYQTWQVAVRRKVIYFEANSLQSLSDLLSNSDNYNYLTKNRSYQLAKMNIPVDTLLSLRLAEKSLVEFKQYQDLYQIASSYISIAKYYNIHGRYDEALEASCAALQCVNQHHKLFYHHDNPADKLLPFAPYDTVTRELKWINGERTKTVPEWISSIREQLSVSYAGLGNKFASDYNRNAYLDILNYTRQDKELETRYKALQRELSTLNVIFLITLAATFAVVFLLILLNKYARKRDKQHTAMLRHALSECRRITTYTSEQATDELERLQHAKVRSREDRALNQVLLPYVKWVIDNRKTLLFLTVEQDRLNKERFLSEQHIAENKRQNIIKKTCLSIVNGVNPYIDRILNEVRKLQLSDFDKDESVRRERIQYIDELVSTIIEYNEILNQWIQMRQGSLSLNIETFELNDLFSLVEKGRRTFEMRKQQFVVDKTNAVIKADKALTLFMINTLAENARKYTPEGGTIHLSAKEEDNYVEIAVEDTGRGLSSDDVQRILGEKVYDSSKIGIQGDEGDDSLKKAKGSGFGLMNCKGIIEKYRKTNPFFDVCVFSLTSVLGKGSRFFFRLPKGIRRTLFMLLCLLLPLTFQSCHHEDEMKEREAAIDSIARIEKRPGFELLLDKASHYADLTYYSNVDHRYAQALLYADSAIYCLNKHYLKYAAHPRYFMALVGKDSPAEIEWWNRSFDSDFHVILDIRNEAAVAFLALKQWDGYQYNNDAYTSLYKLLGEDKSLGEYCRHLKRSATDKTVELAFCLLLLVIAGAGYYFLYARKRIINRMNLEQVFAINETILNASLQPSSDNSNDTLRNVEDTLTDIPRNIVNASFDAFNELISIDRLGLAVYSSATKNSVFVCNPPLDSMPMEVKECFEKRTPLSYGNQEAFPLLVETLGEQKCVGVLYLEIHDGISLRSERLLLQMVAEYTAIVVLNSILNLMTNYHDIESTHEEIDRVSYEDSQLHVQNMVLDNCLSTIKHETIYYPSKIKQTITRLEKGSAVFSEKEAVSVMGELIDYYRGIYTILNQCAARQLEDVTFRRTVIPVSKLTDYAKAEFLLYNHMGDALSLVVEPADYAVIGDLTLLQFLLDNLINEALSVRLEGKLILKARDDGDFIRFDFIDTRRSFPQEELNKLFYPQRDRMDYLICRQIIREHDEYGGRRGCRINSEICAEGGFSVYFTLTKK